MIGILSLINFDKKPPGCEPYPSYSVAPNLHFVFTNPMTGSGGCSVSWTSYVGASQVASGAHWTNYLGLWI